MLQRSLTEAVVDLLAPNGKVIIRLLKEFY